MAKYFECGFMRTAVLLGLERIHYTKKHDRYIEFIRQFSICNLVIEEKHFHRKSGELHKFCRKNSWWGNNKQKHKEFFSKLKWNIISDDVKKEHSLHACKICASYIIEQSIFPAPIGHRPNTKLSSTPEQCKINIEIPVIDGANREKTPYVVNAAASVLKEINKSWENLYQSPFTNIIRKIPEVNLTPRKSKVEKQKQLRKIHQQVKNSIERGWNSENRDVETMYGTRQSGSSHEKQRKTLFLEKKEIAVKRTLSAQLSDDSVPPRKRRHSQDPNKIVFDKEALLAEVNNMENGSKINLSAFAKSYGIQGPTGNMVIKEFLENNGVDLGRFSSQMSTSIRVRRRYEKMPGGSGVSVPIPREYKKIREAMLKGVESGEYLTGVLIEPKKFKKHITDKNGSIKEVEYEVSGRKIPLDTIRERIYKKHEELGILRPARLIHRHLVFWADHASILNNGYLMLTVRVVYTPKIFYTDYEILEKKNLNYDIQEIVEAPQLYILGKANDTLAEKLTFTETRLEDIVTLKPIVVNETIITDEVRFFIGDHPEIQSECGNSQGGKFPCMCGCPANQFTNLNLSFTSTIKSLEDRRLKVVHGPAGRKKGCIRPFENLKVHEFLNEMAIREIEVKKNIALNQQSLKNHFKNYMTGIIRVPALCYNNETKSMKQLNIPNYEVSPIEPLHDLKGHIKNLWDVLPGILPAKTRKEFQDILHSCFGSKGKLRGADYRLSLLIIYNSLNDSLTDDIRELLSTLLEISHGAYSKANKRTPKSVLRLFNVTFKHALICRNLFLEKSKKITDTKVFGIYFHTLTTHLPEMARIVAPSSLHTENEERLFSDLNSISLTTSSRKDESILDNCIIRIQMEMKWKSNQNNGNTSKFSTSKISQFSRQALQECKNTAFDLETIDQNLYQIHLERIAEYLIYGEGVWWHHKATTNEIVFHDSEESSEYHDSQKLLDFSSHNLQEAAMFVEKCWKQCLDENIKIPIPAVKLYNSNGDYTRTKVIELTKPTENEEFSEQNT